MVRPGCIGCFLLLFLITLSSCSFISPAREITVHFPSDSFWQSSGIGEPWYILQWPGPEGEISSQYVRPGISSVVITAGKGADIPVLAQLFGTYDSLGGWVGCYAQDTAVQLSHQKGELASLYIDLWKVMPERCAELCLSSWYLEYARLKDEAVSKGNGEVLLPQLDKAQMMISITTGEITSASLRLLPMAHIQPENLGEGRWVYSADQAITFWNSSAHSDSLKISYPGTYVFYQDRGNGRFRITIDGEGKEIMTAEEKPSFPEKVFPGTF